MKKIFIPFLLLGILLPACSEKPAAQNIEVTVKQYEIILSDSIKIPYLGRPILHDISPSNQKILFTEIGEFDMEIFTANFDGEIIHSFISNGNTIVGNLKLVAPLRLENEGNSFLSFGVLQVKIVSLDGTEVETIFTGIPSYYSAFPSPSNEIVIRNNKIFYNNRSDDGTYNRYQKEYLPNLKLIGYFDLDSSKTTNFLSFPEESIYQNGLIFPHSNWVSHFIFSKDELLVVFEGEPAIFVYEGEAPFSFKQRIELNLPDFKAYKGHPEGEDGIDIMVAFSALGKIESIKMAGKYIVIGYKKGFTDQQMINLGTAISPQEKGKMIREYEKENSSRIQLLDEKFQVLDDFPKPKNLNISSLMVRDGHLWGSKFDSDSEEDFFTIYKLEIQEKEKPQK